MKKQTSKRLKFDPVVREGLYRVDYQGHKKLYTAIDEASAKYQLIDEFNLFPTCNSVDELIEQKELRETILRSIKVWCIRKTIRQSDRARAKRSQNKINMSVG